MFNFVNGNSVVCSNGQVFINGEKIETPKSMKTNSVVQYDNKIYIGGYQFFPEEKKFKKTIRAFLECYILN